MGHSNSIGLIESGHSGFKWRGEGLKETNRPLCWELTQASFRSARPVHRSVSPAGLIRRLQTSVCQMKKMSCSLCYRRSAGAGGTPSPRPRRFRCDARRAQRRPGQRASGRRPTPTPWQLTASWGRAQRRRCWRLPGGTAGSGWTPALKYSHTSNQTICSDSY